MRYVLQQGTHSQAVACTVGLSPKWVDVIPLRPLIIHHIGRIFQNILVRTLGSSLYNICGAKHTVNLQCLQIYRILLRKVRIY